jgi:hypothetical protein
VFEGHVDFLKGFSKNEFCQGLGSSTEFALRCRSLT